MKYAVWFVRLVFAAWFIPAGLNHFVPLFPQPMGNQPLSTELITALIDSHLFDLVKAVELIAGISALTGWYAPLMLVVCMPVSFCVWYWDTPLQGWGSTSAIYGSAALLSNAILCAAFIGSYRALLAPSFAPRDLGATGKQLLLAARLLFGAWMLVSGLNYFAGTLYPMPSGTEPLAVQLMSALVDTKLIGVAMGIQLVAGALLVVGVFVPLALCVVMPVNICAAYWAVVLEHQPMGALLALVAVALNGGLMLAWLGAYRGMLERRALMVGEAQGANFDTIYANPMGGTPPPLFGIALVPLAATAAIYYFVVSGLTGRYCLITLLIPAAILLARGAQGMKSAPA
jgi:uncharacterized membrane protein YphA (DoxX/SURF4 family)